MAIKTSLLVLGGIGAAVLFGGVSIFSSINSTQKEGVAYETTLNAQYLDNQNELSAYISGFYEQTGLANLKSDKMDKILTDAVKGRYEGKDPSSAGPMFQAIKEAYPDITGSMGLYDKILDYVQAGRTAYKNKQSKLLDELRAFDSWKESGIIHSTVVKFMGYPDHNLVARIGTQTWHGADAEDRMYVIVLTDSTTQAYTTGKMAPLDPTKSGN